jgi:O-antigen/teichoic acid export membrane protein
MATALPSPTQPDESLAGRVRRAVIWRSGSQLASQLVQWASTFLVIRILLPRDYGLFAMTQVVLVLLNMLNGYGLASGLIQQREVTRRQIGQLFGMLLLLDLGLGVAQALLAPVFAAYYHQPAVADLLRVQALLFIATPFNALGYALLSRGMEFRRQASANVAASLAGAITALAGALAGWGVWTLVAAPMALFAVRGAMMMRAAMSGGGPDGGGWIMPVFDFRGAGALARFGGVMAAGQMFWFVQSQADIFIAGRTFSPHALGLYSTALLLTQIFVAKVMPPLNEVAFSAYARMHDGDGDEGTRASVLATGFARALRTVMLAALPFYFGLAATAAPVIETVLGTKWSGMAPVVRLLALAMPFMTVQVLLAPACDARGRPGIGVGNGAIGAAILVVAFTLGVHHGPTGLAWAWLLAYPVYLAISLWRSLPVIGVRAPALADAVAPALLAATAMAAVVTIADGMLPVASPPLRLTILASLGGVVYAGWLTTFARPVVVETIAMLRGRR